MTEQPLQNQPDSIESQRINFPRRKWALWAMLIVSAVTIGLGLSVASGVGTDTTRPPVTATTTAPAVIAANLNQRFKSQIQPILEKNCYACHADGQSSGDLNLDPYVDLKSVQIGRDRWLHISRMIGQNLMPPPKKTQQPTSAERNTVVAWINEAVNFCDCSGPRDSGRVAIHRLNRNEYNNTIHDLLGVDFKPAKDFPADDTGYGFDNIADVLSMSPLLAEKYLNAAEQSMEQLSPTENPNRPRIKRFDAKSLSSKGDRNKPLLLVMEGSTSAQFNFLAGGQYEIRLRGFEYKLGKDDAKLDLKLDNNNIGSVTFTALKDKPAIMSAKFNADPGRQTLSAVFTNPYKEKTDAGTTERAVQLEYIEVEGPLDAKPPAPSPMYQQIFFIKPATPALEDSVAQAILKKFAGRAFRRPVDDTEVMALWKIYKAARSDGDEFEPAVRSGLIATLMSPQFLFRVEIDPPAAKLNPKDPKPYLVSDYELASRLSYFLWSSMPDDELMSAASYQKLHDPATLTQQITRMLKDPRSSALTQNFPGQWLELRNLQDFKPDIKIFPTWNDDLRNDMAKETSLFFANIVHEDRSILELLNGDYTFINERLANHYGIPNVRGNDFRKVSLAGTPRGGVLTQAAVLAVTAMPTRTSPVKRGKFILANVLGTDIPPPPPNVPSLSDSSVDISKATLRQRLEIHRQNPSCAVCHTQMDSLGFALENFDAIGRWRDKDGNFPIDSVGTLPDGTKISGAEGLRKLIVARQDDFVRTLIGKMLTYALGRGLEYYDECTVKDIEASVRKNDYKFSSLVMAIVMSEPFQKRRLLRPEEMRIFTERAKSNDPEDMPKK